MDITRIQPFNPGCQHLTATSIIKNTETNQITSHYVSCALRIKSNNAAGLRRPSISGPTDPTNFITCHSPLCSGPCSHPLLQILKQTTLSSFSGYTVTDPCLDGSSPVLPYPLGLSSQGSSSENLSKPSLSIFSRKVASPPCLVLSAPSLLPSK